MVREAQLTQAEQADPANGTMDVLKHAGVSQVHTHLNASSNRALGGKKINNVVVLRLIQKPVRLSSYWGWWAGVSSLWEVSLEL